jgi:stage V sporulation protein AC
LPGTDNAFFLNIFAKSTKNNNGDIVEKQIFQKVLNNTKVKRPVVKNSLQAFLVGGIIALLGQALLDFYQLVVNLEEKVATSLMSITLVFLASLLTGLGIYDRIGQFAGAGSIIPITGFSNSMTSAALESKSEGIVLGIMTNMFKLAGAVIVAGIVSAFFSATLIYLFSR